MGHFYGWKMSREFLFVLISDEPTKPTLYPLYILALFTFQWHFVLLKSKKDNVFLYCIHSLQVLFRLVFKRVRYFSCGWLTNPRNPKTCTSECIDYLGPCVSCKYEE